MRTGYVARRDNRSVLFAMVCKHGPATVRHTDQAV